MRTYRTDRTYRWNYEHGPAFAGPYPPVPATPMKSFLGLPVRSRFGISAGLLLNSRWIATYARLGFDLLTYKTVRTRARRSYPLPNWVLVEADEPLAPGKSDAPVYRRRRPARRPEEWTSAVCFGMPSMAPEVWRADIAAARSALGDGQLLLVSVVGTPQSDRLDDLAADFAGSARGAAQAGAHVVELNLSCPNVASDEGTLYLDPRAARTVVTACRAALPRTPLLAKIGYLPDPGHAARLLDAVADRVDGLVMVNAIARPVLERDGRPVFGLQHRRVGVIGAGIHPACVANFAMLRELRDRLGLSLSLCAVGGVVRPEDARPYFEEGAAAVFAGGAPMFDPYLAVRLKRRYPEW